MTCSVCGSETSHLKSGRDEACYRYWLRHGKLKERPPKLFARSRDVMIARAALERRQFAEWVKPLLSVGGPG